MKKTFFVTLLLAVSLMMGACWGKSDADIAKAATDALKKDAKFSTLNVAVKDGVATITGTADAATKTAAEAALKGVEGVKSVTNSVTVPTPTPVAEMAGGDDTTVKTAIDKALKEKGIAITVNVVKGEAILTGDLPKAKLPDAMAAVSSAKPGKITNKLTLK